MNTFLNSVQDITESDYNSLVQYARRKAQLTGEGEEYVTLLLPDVIREFRMHKVYDALYDMNYCLQHEAKEDTQKWQTLL